MQPDVVVVGAGPAGLSAALALSEAGAAVRVIDEQPAAGGQIYRALERVARERPDSLAWYGPDYARGFELLQRFDRAGIEYSPSTQVWDISDNAGRNGIGLLRDDRAEILYPQHIVLATGAMERPTPFPGWTLPGVMTVGAAQTLFKEFALVPQNPPVIAGGGPLAYLFAHQLIEAGIKPALMLDTGPSRVPVGLSGHLLRALAVDAGSLFKGLAWLRDIARAGVRRVNAIESISARGGDRLRSVEYRVGDRTETVECELLLVHDGVIPNVQLAMAAGCEHRWNRLQRYWQPLLDTHGASSRRGIWIAGDTAAIDGADAAACDGWILGWHLARELSLADDARYREQTRRFHERRRRIAALRAFLDRMYRPFAPFQRPDNDTLVCRCERVTAGEILHIAALGCMGPNQAKAFTRCGMGPCMGRQCGNAVSALLAHAHDRDLAEIGHFRIRSPVKPITVGQLANLDQN